jgi:hypothetical protein
LKIIAVILAGCVLLISSPYLIRIAKQAKWDQDHRDSSMLQKPAMRVWVAKQVGFYYCPDSVLYGKAKPGAWMTQGQALETGYRSATGEFCR